MAVPDTVLTNADLAARVDTNDEWITQRTGIRERRVLSDGASVRDLARQAVQQAMASADVTGPQLDMLICATLRPEMVCPSTAARVVAEIGAVPAAAVDLNAACSGFVYALNFASSLIRTGAAGTVAVVGAEALTKITDWSDRRTCVLFGDGAGAAILTASDDPRQGLLHQTMASDGSMWKELYCPRDAAQVPADDKVFSGTFDTLQMNGREIYKFAVSTLQKTIEKVLIDNDLRADDLSMVIAHQSNARILESARERLGLPEDKLYINIDRYGNTSAASIPICLHELNAAGRIRPGDLVLFVGLGGGLTWASALWRV